MNNIELNRINQLLLSKQHLTEDSRISDCVQIVRDIFGLHATSPMTPYLSLFQRARNFTKDKLDKELSIKRSLAKIRCVRKTVYIVPLEMLAIVHTATKAMVEPASEQYRKYLGITHREYEETSHSILTMLKGTGMTASEIKSALKTKLSLHPILNLMCDQCLLVRGIPKGWKSNLHTYYLFQEYFPGLNLRGINELEAKKLLVKQYLASFGPVTENDITWWTGFPKQEVRQILHSFQKQITQFNSRGLEGSNIMLSSEREILELVKLSKNHIVNLLPSLDPYIMGYKIRERYLSKKYYNYVFDRTGNAAPTILLDGIVIGVWDFAEDPEPSVKVFFFQEVAKKIYQEIQVKANEVGNFIANGEVEVKRCCSMAPLSQRTAGAVMSPLKGCQ